MTLMTVNAKYAIQKMMIQNLKTIAINMGKIYPIEYVAFKNHVVIKNYMSSKKDISIYPCCVRKNDRIILQYSVLDENYKLISSVQCPIDLDDKMNIVKWLNVRPLIKKYIKLNNLDINDYLYLKGL